MHEMHLSPLFAMLSSTWGSLTTLYSLGRPLSSTSPLDLPPPLLPRPSHSRDRLQREHQSGPQEGTQSACECCWKWFAFLRLLPSGIWKFQKDIESATYFDTSHKSSTPLLADHSGDLLAACPWIVRLSRSHQADRQQTFQS